MPQSEVTEPEVVEEEDELQGVMELEATVDEEVGAVSTMEQALEQKEETPAASEAKSLAEVITPTATGLTSTVEVEEEDAADAIVDTGVGLKPKKQSAIPMDVVVIVVLGALVLGAA